MSITTLTGDCREVMKTLPDSSVDAIVCDPPYELGFMGKTWDSTGVANDVTVWREALRVLKPGGHLLAFGGTRTYHRMVCAIEDAGFEIRDQIGWVYGSGFPKSLDVSKAIDKAAGAERTAGGREWSGGARSGGISHGGEQTGTAGRTIFDEPATDAARQWQGWGTALKPAWEPIVMARKPLIGTVAANVLAHGTGALNIDGCRVETDELAGKTYNNTGKNLSWGGTYGKGAAYGNDIGRWPANLIHDGSDEVLAAFPLTGPSTGGGRNNGDKFGGGYAPSGQDVIGFGDTGSAARFFYCAKADSEDRHDGLEHPGPQFAMGSTPRDAEKVNAARKGNHHPTVKPTDLMRYLCLLVTPPGGTVLDPFMGSGSTLKAAELEGFSAIGIEMDPAYVEIARRRIASDMPLFKEVTP